MIDENIFFREATLRICSSLDMEKSLRNCLIFLRDYIPSDFITISVVNAEMGVLERIAGANTLGNHAPPVVLTVSAALRDRYHEAMQHPDRNPHVFIVNRVKENAMIGPLLIRSGLADANVLIMRIRIEEKILGYVTVGSEYAEDYAQRHADLLALLNDPFAIALSNHLHHREVARLRDLLLDDNRYLRSELRQHVGEEIVGADSGLKQVMDWVHHVAPLSSPVLLLGETGTGKELIANAIHHLSPRKDGPLIKVNCGAIPGTLMDSELFGHEKGAFTGAVAKKRGRFERAHQGTIFLDEIGELTPEAQVRLLRVLQDKEIERVGGTEPIPVDIRVIAATHRNLDDMLKAGTFREDIYFRLCVFPISIPPLRERRQDIPPLVQHFIWRKTKEMGLARTPTLNHGALERLLDYSWPGNVRELQNVVERSLILSRGAPLDFEAFNGAISEKTPAPAPQKSIAEEMMGLDQAVSQHILKALTITGGRIRGDKGAARLLEINPSTLRKKMGRLGLVFDKDKPPATLSDFTPAYPPGLSGAAAFPQDFMGLDRMVARYISQALDRTHGQVGGERGAARLLQINPSTLRKKMKKLAIPTGEPGTGPVPFPE